MTEATYSPDDLAARFGVPRRRVIEWNATYKWPHTRIGRHIYWTESQLATILVRHVVSGGRVKNADGRTKRSKARAS